MAVITGGNVIRGGVILVGSGPRKLHGTGAPTGSTYSGVVAVGDLYIDQANDNVYEYTEPAAVPTFTRIDTV